MVARLQEVADPAAMGVDPDRLAIFVDRVRMEVEQGALPSAQVAVARHGRLVLDRTFGDASPTDRYILQSVGRSVVAGVVWKLLGEGALGLDERVGDVIPEFATNGKEVVTVEQVLDHTAGFPFAPWATRRCSTGRSGWTPWAGGGSPSSRAPSCSSTSPPPPGSSPSWSSGARA